MRVTKEKIDGYCRMFQKAQLERKEANSKYDVVKDELIALMSNDAAIGKAFKAMRINHPKIGFDLDRLKIEIPAIYEKYCVQRDCWTVIVTAR